MDEDLLELEEELRSFAPTAISADVVSRMVSAMESWETSEEIADVEGGVGKVVAFPSDSSSHKRQRSSWHPTWAAAAAVAIVGALGALVVPQSNSNGAGVTAMAGLGPVPLLRQASLVPVKAERNVSSMDAGVISDRKGTPYQVLRVIRQEEANFEGANNVGLKISRPKVDYFVVPVSY
jgi:hypothetical protein